ncbi:MAG: hypothetical protein A2096_00620 [Spirochaetes bacterium GWF1_41_5]|nr:MAG: hypothetical protein A2096_00620 [Spirochaetes bacterium GWF1_41_5]
MYKSQVNSIIGEGCESRGEFNFSGSLRIDGKFEGNIIVDGKILIGQSGVAFSDIHAEEITIGGTVFGNIYAKNKVVLLKTAYLRGNIYTKRVSAEEGVVFEGKCNIIREN